MSEPLLELRHVSKRFGGLTAVDDLSFRVVPGEIKAIIGPNGAGKTTAFNLISGLLPADEGEKAFRRQRIDHLAPHQIAALGIARTFQHVQVFDNMTVLQNVMVGRHARTRGAFLMPGLNLAGCRRQERGILQTARECLDLVGLQAKAGEAAGNLPYGEQKMLEVARAMAMDPELLLLDEPAAGLNDTETEQVAVVIKRIQARGVTILLVEHDMSLVMGISDDILVLNYGTKIAEGGPSAIQAHPQVIEAYLGEEIDA